MEEVSHQGRPGASIAPPYFLFMLCFQMQMQCDQLPPFLAALPGVIVVWARKMNEIRRSLIPSNPFCPFL